MQCANANCGDHSERTIFVFGGKKRLETKLIFRAAKPVEIEMLHINRILFGGIAIYRTTQGGHDGRIEWSRRRAPQSSKINTPRGRLFG